MAKLRLSLSRWQRHRHLAWVAADSFVLQEESARLIEERAEVERNLMVHLVPAVSIWIPQDLQCE